MNEHDQSLLDLYNLMMAKKAMRMQLKLTSKAIEISDLLNEFSKAYPQAMLYWAKSSSEELQKIYNYSRYRS